MPVLSSCRSHGDTLNPSDDPEQQIRDLEPAATQPSAEGGPQRPGMRLGWIVLGLLVIGLLIGGGAMLAERMAAHGKPVAGRPTTPPVVGGGGSFIPPPPTSSARPPYTLPPPATRNGQISVAGIDKVETHACNGGVANISGVNNRVVLTGRCTSVEVSGVRNTVIIEESDAIIVSGLNNDVTFQNGSPEVSQSGFDNTVARS